MPKGAPGMPLTAGLHCWGDLGRYEGNNFGLPTLSEYAQRSTQKRKLIRGPLRRNRGVRHDIAHRPAWEGGGVVWRGCCDVY
eukprot:scaffold55078_cov73-Phaeocystis_antarctica.AAC.1